MFPVINSVPQPKGYARFYLDTDPNLVGRWLIDNENKATDLSIRGNNGTAGGGVTIGGVVDHNNQPSKATFFDNSDDFISCGNVLNDVIAGVGKKFSISAWIRQDATAAASKDILAKLADGPTGGNERQLSFLVVNGKLRFGWFGNLSTGVVKIIDAETTLITPGNWFHVVVNYDGTLAVDLRTSFYINNIPQAISIPITQGSPISIPVGVAPLVIGAARFTATAYTFNGNICNVRMYSRILTKEDAKSLWDKRT